jgi:hypothetical protein
MKEPAAVLFEMVKLCDLDVPGEGTADQNRDQHAGQRPQPVVHHPSHWPEINAGPNVRAGLVLVPEIGASSGTITAYKNGITNGIKRRKWRNPRKMHKVATSPNLTISPISTTPVE